MQTIETKRLYIRAFKKTDGKDIYDFASLPEVGPEAGWLPHKCLEDSEAMACQWAKDPSIFALCDKTTNRVIGSLSLIQRFDRAVRSRELGYSLNPQFWGQGLMSEAVDVMIDYAFEIFGVEMLTVKHHHLNQRSFSVIKKAGFIYEGTLRQARRHLITGELLDCVCYSMTRKEWKMRK